MTIIKHFGTVLQKTYQIILLSLGEGHLIFYCAGSLENYLGLVGLQNSTTTNSFKIDALKKKNIDHWDLETWVIMSTQVTNETDHTHVLLDSTMLWFNKFLLFCKGIWL